MDEDFVMWGLSDSSDDAPDEGDDTEFHEVSFVPDDIRRDAREIATFMNIHEDVAMLCLQTAFWDKEKVLTGDRSKMLAELGIPLEESNEPQNLHELTGEGSMMCDVCANEYPKQFFLELGCHHSFCTNCWKSFIEESVNEGRLPVHCMQPDCQRRLLPANLQSLCGEIVARTAKKKLDAIAISTSKRVVPCVNPHCDLTVSLEDVGLCWTAKCQCGTRVCWLCGKEAHAPLICSEYEKFVSSDEGSYGDVFVMSLTKACPKCKTRILKDGGCNHMTCTQCGYQFCWICSHEWTTHEGDAYSCTSMPLNNTGESSADYEMEICCRHFRAHYLAEILETKNAGLIREKLERMWILQKGTIQLAYTPARIIEILLEGRSVLKWSYPFRNTIPKTSPQRQLFEFSMIESEKAIENLAHVLEKCNNPLPAMVIPRTNALEQATITLLKHGDGLMSGMKD